MNNVNLINTTDAQTVNAIVGRTGKFRAIVKCRAGFLTVVDAEVYGDDLTSVLKNWKPKALQTLEFLPEGCKHWLTVFIRTGKKIHCIDEELIENMTVGDINVYFAGTTLHSQYQYDRVGARTWADKAFVQNKAA